MKKFIFSVALAALAIGATSCLGDTPDSTFTANADTYNFVEAIDGKQDPVLTKGGTVLEANFSKATIETYVKAVMPDMSISFQTGTLPLKVGQQSYEFSVASAGTSATDIHGYFTPNPGLLFTTYVVDDTYNVYSTADYIYNFATLKVHENESPASEISYTTKEVAFMVVPDCEKNTASFQMKNFRLAPAGIISVVTFEDIPFTLAKGGLINVVEENTKMNKEENSEFVVKDLNLTVNAKACKASATFIMAGKFVELAGDIFMPVAN